uniref:Uncharacterized protein n=1 Tax=Acrobeloides nanus TaxID=290746 RepID=A0A914CC03_9BILA
MAFKKTASLDDLVIITAFSYNHISEAEEYDLILYVDTSVIFKNVNGSSIKDLITVANTPKYELGTILLSRTGHSIKAATNPKMYKYLPINDTLASKTEMFGATSMLWRKTPMSLEILKSLVICSMLPDCLSPMGSYLYCDNNRLSKGEYANCHRFDQSAVNILLVNASNGDTNRYVILNPILKIERD